MNKLKIATQFSKAPGPRYPEEGEHSGEEFRTQVLIPALEAAAASQSILEVDLDGTFGYGTSFLEEAFGGLIRINGFRLSDLNRLISFTSKEEPELIDEILSYMQDAEEQEHPNG